MAKEANQIIFFWLPTIKLCSLNRLFRKAITAADHSNPLLIISALLQEMGGALPHFGHSPRARAATKLVGQFEGQLKAGTFLSHF
jgi:hypothetical protein